MPMLYIWNANGCYINIALYAYKKTISFYNMYFMKKSYV